MKMPKTGGNLTYVISAIDKSMDNNDNGKKYHANMSKTCLFIRPLRRKSRHFCDFGFSGDRFDFSLN